MYVYTYTTTYYEMSSINGQCNTVDEVKKIMHTYVFVQDAEDFEWCQVPGPQRTKFMWMKKNHGELVTEEEDHNLRRRQDYKPIRKL
jgi:hypothetical protein